MEVSRSWVGKCRLDIERNGHQDGIIIGASSLQYLESNLDDLEKGPLSEDIVAHSIGRG